MAQLTVTTPLPSSADRSDFESLVNDAAITNVVANDLASGAVTTTKIADLNVTLAKLSTSGYALPIIMSPPVAAKSIAGSSSVSWTDLDLSSIAPDVEGKPAKGFWLSVQCVDTAAGGRNIQFRTNGTAEGNLGRIVNTGSAGEYNTGLSYVECDSNQVIEYQLEAGGVGTFTAEVKLFAYHV